MKKVLVILLVATALLTMSSCVESIEPSASTPKEQIPLAGGLEFIGYSTGYTKGTDTDHFYYYRDIVTDVMYVCFEDYRKGGITEMHDPETGLPLTYTRYLALIDQANREAKE